MIVGIRANLRIPKLIPRSFEIYSRVLTSVALRGLELVIHWRVNPMFDHWTTPQGKKTHFNWRKSAMYQVDGLAL